MSIPKDKQTDDERKVDITLLSQTINTFLNKELMDDMEEENGFYSSDIFDENETNDDYGSSGEKYGWYNGFSDDAIDDAFGGDPDAKWNVD